MNLILEIVDNPPVDIFQKSMRFDHRGGKIGRSKTAKWTLNDPTKHISNFHAEVTFSDNQYFLTDISSNGMFLKTPYKKFVKGAPVALTQKSAIMIGDYTIAVKTLESDFTNKELLATSDTPLSAGIPDTFFVGDMDKEAFGVIEPSSAEEKDIVSLLDNDSSQSNVKNDILLPELDSIMGVYDDELDMTSNDSLSTNIEPPSFQDEPVEHEEAKVAPQSNTSDNILQILSLKLGIDFGKMDTRKQELFITEIADLALNSLNKLRATYKTLEKIKYQLGVNSVTERREVNPLKTTQNNKEIFENIQNYSLPISRHAENLFHEIDAHNIAFHATHKNLSLRIAEKFSPEKLYFSFEKKNLLSKNFTNKKALAWEAYCEKFKELDSMDMDTLNLADLQKEYKHVLETINLGYNT